MSGSTLSPGPPTAAGARPRVVILRGPFVNPWELRPWELLQDRYDVEVLVPRVHPQDLGSLALRRVKVRTLSDLLPTRRLALMAAPLPPNRYLGLRRLLRGAAIVHAAELHPWFTAQPAALRAELGFRLVTTVWETIPFRVALRHPLSRGNRRRVLDATDLFLATTERARAGLLLEGADAERIRVAPPGVDVERFSAAAAAAPPRSLDDPVVISPGRLVWEKGHQDAIRAVAALRSGLVEGPPAARRVRLLILGSGPEEARLRSYAADLGLADAVELRAHVPYDDMPAMYASASAMVLGSLPIPSWEEQFGMVLAEAMAAGLPIVTTMSGAIPEVVGGDAQLVGPGDWLGLARALAAGPLAQAAGHRIADPSRLETYGVEATAQRLADAYAAVLDGAARPAASATA